MKKSIVLFCLLVLILGWVNLFAQDSNNENTTTPQNKPIKFSIEGFYGNKLSQTIDESSDLKNSGGKGLQIDYQISSRISLVGGIIYSKAEDHIPEGNDNVARSHLDCSSTRAEIVATKDELNEPYPHGLDYYVVIYRDGHKRQFDTCSAAQNSIDIEGNYKQGSGGTALSGSNSSLCIQRLITNEIYLGGKYHLIKPSKKDWNIYISGGLVHVSATLCNDLNEPTALHYQLIPELIGNTFVIEENTGSRYLLVDSSSVSNEIFKFKIFVSYIF